MYGKDPAYSSMLIVFDTDAVSLQISIQIKGHTKTKMAQIIVL